MIDFGLSGLASEPAHSGGSPWYIPPEYIDPGEAHGKPADVFALGVTMVWVLGLCPLPDRRETWPIGNIHLQPQHPKG
jgi:serine/threonine protein kinase